VSGTRLICWRFASRYCE